MRPSSKATTKAALGEITLRDEEGKATAHAYCDVWRFRDGRMAQLRAFVIEKTR